MLFFLEERDGFVVELRDGIYTSARCGCEFSHERRFDYLHDHTDRAVAEVFPYETDDRAFRGSHSGAGGRFDRREGARIEGNPYKFVGKNVDLHCVVSDVPDARIVNATCPPNEYGGGPNIVVETDSRGLEKGQSIRVIGTVVDPIEGNNAMGGQMKFPTVKAEFME